jgi:RNA polymerase sigma-70 factor (ECF subfamily)
MELMSVTRLATEEDDRMIPSASFREHFEGFYSRELRPVIGLAYVLSGSRSGAEDIAQEAFLAAFKDWERVGSLDDPGAWVRRVVANNAVSRFRRRTAEVKALLRIESGEFAVPEVSVESVTTWEAVRALPKRQAQVVALRYYEQRSIADIGLILNCSENTIKTHLRRAKQSLADRLGVEERHEDS